MEGFFSAIIPLLIAISVVSSIVSNIKKNQQKSNKGHKEAPKSQQSLRELMREQVLQQGGILKDQFNNIVNLEEPKNTRYREGDKLNRKTLEGTPVEHQRHSHNAHIGGSYNEGDKLNRDTLEGITLEGGFSYGEDDMSLDALDVDNSDVLSVQRAKKSARKPRKSLQYSGGGSHFRELKMNRDSIVTGVIMSEILEKRGGRRSVR